MNTLLRSIIAGLMLSGSLPGTSAHADPAAYFGLQYGMMTYEENRVPDLEPVAGILRLGRHGEGRFSYEARLGLGLDSGRGSIFDATVKAEMDSLFGFYMLAQLGAPESISLYGIFGFSRMEATSRASLGAFSGSVSHTESGPSFGVGLNYGGFGEMLLNIEYMSYVSGDDFSADIIGLGVLF